jgi:hypothetical protein
MKIAINLSDSRGRDSQVLMESHNVYPAHERVDARKQPVQRCRAIKNTLETDYATLTRDCEAAELSQQLIDGDPEIDFELFGKQVWETSRVYLNENNTPAFGVRRSETIYSPDGEVKGEREPELREGNVALEKPLKWSKHLLPKKQFYKRFVFANTFQLSHVNGLTFDFLYDMAKELEEKDAFLLLAAGENSNQPLILQRNGSAYRGLLEGRTDGDKYMLLLHLTNLELKSIVKPEPEA